MQTVELHRDSRFSFGRIAKIQPGEPDIIVSLKSAGDMKTGGNALNGFLHEFHIDLQRFYRLHQIHSCSVLTSGAGISWNTDGDGLFAGDSRHVLGVSVADCMPIFLFHAASQRFAVVHSGWKGTGIAVQALQMFQDLHAISAQEVSAVLGPSIRSCCYQVDTDRAQLFYEAWGREAVKWCSQPPAYEALRMNHEQTATSAARHPRPSEPQALMPFLDLLSANKNLLQKHGVKDIRIVDECTACSPDFGSFRREGPNQFTHMLAMIGYFQ